MATRHGDTLLFSQPPVISAWAAVGGKKEGEGPLAPGFDELCQDNRFGQSSWEAAEKYLQLRAARLCLQKGKVAQQQIELALAGDLQAQCNGFQLYDAGAGGPFCRGVRGLQHHGRDPGPGRRLPAAGMPAGSLAMTSSHSVQQSVSSARRSSYGAVRTPTAQWTATAAGCCLVQAEGRGPLIMAAAFGRVQDYAIKDINNMGAGYRASCGGHSAALF